MAKITLPDAVGGFQSVALTNSNTKAIESALNDEVLYRVNPEGEPNSMEVLIDMNDNRIINVRAATFGGATPSGGDLVTFQDLDELEDSATTSPTILNLSNRTVIEVTEGVTHTATLASSESYTRIGGIIQTDIVIPLDSALAWLDSTELHFRQIGSGLTQFVTTNGVTINVPFSGTLVLAGTGATVTLKKVAADEWDLIGQTTVG